VANTQSMCTSFMGELMTATHNFGTAPTRGTSAADTFKAALYLATATVDASTTAFSATDEVSGSGYTSGGIAVTMQLLLRQQTHLLRRAWRFLRLLPVWSTPL
jgi:hypothetical protein